MWGVDMDVSALQSRGAMVGCHGIFNFRLQKHSGFTLVELLTTVAILSVVLGLGIPSLQHFLATNRAASQTNQLVGTLALSRSEAIKRGQRITLCQTSSKQECESTGNWSRGWMLFIDENKNKTVDEDEQMLYSGDFLSGGTQVTFNGAFGIDGYVIYKADGSAFPNGSFTICLDKNPDYGKALILFRTGRLRLSNKTAQGKPIDCS
jgi:type IV fimbrial biogenesis protein FimT